jgi:hypothetical protein
MSTFPNVPISNIFNSVDYTAVESENLTLANANLLYLKITGGICTGSLTINNNIDVLGQYYLNSTPVALNTITGVTAGTASASKALILDSSSDIVGIDKLSATNLEVRSSSTSILSTLSPLSAYGLQLVSSLSATNGALKGASLAFGHSTTDVAPFGTIVCQKMSTTTGDIVFSNRIDSTSVAESCRIRSDGSVYAKKCLQVGSSDNTRFISCLDSTMAASTSKYVCFGRAQSSNDQAELSFYLTGNGSTSNMFQIGFYGTGNLFNFQATGNLGIGTTAPVCPLDISTSVSVQIASTGTVYQCLLTTGFSSNATPFSANLSARFRSNIWVQNTLYCTSDRRVKKDINDLDFTLDHYMKLQPKSYRMKDDDKRIHLGLIAQDMLSVCSEAVVVNPNEDMHVEEEGDLEGAQYSIDYNCINMMNVCAIKKLIKKNIMLEERLTQLENLLKY